MRFLQIQAMIIKSALAHMSRTPSYIDPLAGSVILQVVLGGVAGIGVAMKMYWHRISAFIGRRTDDPASNE
jgi:hypothetical protein